MHDSVAGRNSAPSILVTFPGDSSVRPGTTLQFVVDGADADEDILTTTLDFTPTVVADLDCNPGSPKRFRTLS